MPIGKGGTANLPTDSSILRHQRQNDFPRSFLCVTLSLAWVPGRSDLKQVFHAHATTTTVFLAQLPHIDCR